MSVPRHLHPAAWWAWALGLGAAAMRTTNPLLLALIAAVAAYVVSARRTPGPWASSYAAFLRLGAYVLGIRLVIEVLFGNPAPGHVLVRLPSVPLPDWAAGMRLGGPVTVEALAAASYDGLRLLVLLGCVGAANSLTSPYRLLRALPGAFYEAGVAVTVAVTFAPQAVASAREIREARRLRGRPSSGLAGLRGLAVPVLEGALARSLHLAESMDSRGFGRRPAGGGGRLPALATLAGLVAVAGGTYGLLDATAPGALGLPLMALGAALLATGLIAGRRRSARTRYRPDPWLLPEWVVALSGSVPLAAFLVAERLPGHALHPFTNPVEVPELPLVALAGVLAALLAAVVAPRPPVATAVAPVAVAVGA